MEKPAVIFDNGSGYSKLGFSGNTEPNLMIPTVISTRHNPNSLFSDLDFYIGQQALTNQTTHNLSYPIQQGQITNWDDMQRLWQRSIYSLLQVNPKEHAFVLTEPPLNPPENREQMAQIMFETFDVKSLYIGVQGIMSLLGSHTGELNQLTGTVVDSGDGVTLIIPVAFGHVISNAIMNFPIAGRDITRFIMTTLKDRKQKVPIEDLLHASRKIKEKYSYICKNMDEELVKYSDPTSSLFKVYKALGFSSKNPLNIRIGPERFLGPQVFFSPEKFTQNWDKPLDQCLQMTIQKTPIHLRRALYQNIYLSGGSTAIKNFRRRLQDSMQARLDQRMERYAESSGYRASPVKCRVNQDNSVFAAWYGASKFACDPVFEQVAHSREQYLEYGPSIARVNAITSYNHQRSFGKV